MKKILAIIILVLTAAAFLVLLPLWMFGLSEGLVVFYCFIIGFPLVVRGIIWASEELDL